jgi:hypothetical protein
MMMCSPGVYLETSGARIRVAPSLSLDLRERRPEDFPIHNNYEHLNS